MHKENLKETSLIVPQHADAKSLEVMCFRQGRKGLDSLLRKENTLVSYWHNFVSSEAVDVWTPEKATSYFQEHTHIESALRYAGELTCEQAAPSDLYFTLLTEADHAVLVASPDQIMWVNSDVLLKKLVEKPDKFKPQLLEMLTLCLRSLNSEDTFVS